MTHFEVNLVQGRVIPLRKRRLMLVGMTVYLVICLALLLVTVSGLVTDVEKGRDLYRQVERTEKFFWEDHPKQYRLLTYVPSLRVKLDELIGKLDGVHAVLVKRCDAVRIVMRLTASIPRSATMSNLDLDPGKGTLSFDLTVPVDEAGYTFSTSEVLDQWSADSMLMREVSTIRAGATQRQRMWGRTVFVIRFSGELRGKES